MVIAHNYMKKGLNTITLVFISIFTLLIIVFAVFAARIPRRGDVNWGDPLYECLNTILTDTDCTLDTNVVTSSDITDATISGADIASNGTINRTHIADDTLGGDDIQNGSIGPDDLGANIFDTGFGNSGTAFVSIDFVPSRNLFFYVWLMADITEVGAADGDITLTLSENQTAATLALDNSYTYDLRGGERDTFSAFYIITGANTAAINITGQIEGITGDTVNNLTMMYIGLPA